MDGVLQRSYSPPPSLFAWCIELFVLWCVVTILLHLIMKNKKNNKVQNSLIEKDHAHLIESKNSCNSITTNQSSFETKNVIKSGRLHKKSNNQLKQQWKVRDFVLNKGGFLSYYDESTSTLKGVINIKNAKLKAVDYDYQDEDYDDNDIKRVLRFTFLLMTEFQTTILSAESESDRKAWITAFQTSIKLANANANPKPKHRMAKSSMIFGVGSNSNSNSMILLNNTINTTDQTSIPLSLGNERQDNLIHTSIPLVPIDTNADVTADNKGTLILPLDNIITELHSQISSPTHDIIDVKSSLSNSSTSSVTPNHANVKANDIDEMPPFNVLRATSYSDLITSMGKFKNNLYDKGEDYSQWQIFLLSGETIIASSIIGKRNAMSVKIMRQLILTSTPRLIYVDPVTMTLKGEVKWLPDMDTRIEKVNASTIKIALEDRTYRFIDDIKGSQYWMYHLEHMCNASTNSDNQNL